MKAATRKASHNPCDRDVALAQYRRRADVYDLELTPFEPIRERALQRLGAAPGHTVLDIGCGTGLSFGGLCHAVGEGGRVVGVEQSPEMVGKAEARVAEAGWANVTLQNQPVHLARLPRHADAALFHFTHDILRDAASVQHVVRHLRPGATVVATGLKWAGLWTWPANWLVLGAALHSVSSLEGMRAPWSHLADALDGVEVETMWFDGIFLACGTVPR